MLCIYVGFVKAKKTRMVKILFSAVCVSNLRCSRGSVGNVLEFHAENLGSYKSLMSSGRTSGHDCFCASEKPCVTCRHIQAFASEEA